MAGRKRPRGEDVTAEFFGTPDKSGSYLKITLNSDKPLRNRGWPWVQAGLRKVLGREKLDKANFLRDGSLLVKTKNALQTEMLLETNMLLDEACCVIRDKKLNLSKGTIHSYDLLDIPESDLVEWLGDFGVVEAKRFTRRVAGKTVPTPTILLTFDAPTCPERLQLDYVTYHVKKHIPNPLMCYKCGTFGHPETTCSKPKRCLDCGAPINDGEHEGECTRKCLNCGDLGHSCRSRDCPRWVKEKAICKLKVEMEVSYAEAKRYHEASHQPPLLQPYSAVVRKPSENQRHEEQILKERVERLERKLDEKLDEMTSLLAKLVESICPAGHSVDKQSQQETSPASSVQASSDKTTMMTVGGTKTDAFKDPLPKPSPQSTRNKPKDKPTARRTKDKNNQGQNNKPPQGRDVDMMTANADDTEESEMASQLISRRHRSSSREGHIPVATRQSWKD